MMENSDYFSSLTDLVADSTASDMKIKLRGGYTCCVPGCSQSMVFAWKKLESLVPNG